MVECRMHPVGHLNNFNLLHRLPAALAINANFADYAFTEPDRIPRMK